VSELRDASCKGKKVFPTWRRAVERATKRRKDTDEILMPYRCALCHGIHVGSTPPDLRQKRVQRKKTIQKAREE
jgi:hypothetical protein